MTELHLSDFHYDLPQDRIAQFPLEKRDDAKLMVARVKERSIEHHFVRDLPLFLTSGSLMILNNSRVIPARLFLHKKTGSRIEIFLLEPEQPGTQAQVLQSEDPVRWFCMIGGSKVPEDTELSIEQSDIRLHARVIKRDENKGLIELSWTGSLNFAEVLKLFGAAPLPPYMKRKSQELDDERYQTVYARAKGSVAAPTAGLHVSESMISTLRQNGVDICELALHVGLGTFEPMKKASVLDHTMHAEYVSIPRSTIEMICSHLLTASPHHRMLCVGTTSLRSVESLFWLARKMELTHYAASETEVLKVSQWQWRELVQQEDAHSIHSTLMKLIEWMKEQLIEDLQFYTQLMIADSYPFRLCDTLLTNFHQPSSSLLVLVEAFCGRSFRKEMYDVALRDSYRFLSYGDTSLLFR